MDQPAEKNFNILISLFLMGVGAGLILVPAHLGIPSQGTTTLLHGVVGVFCFLTALLLQVLSVWRSSHWRKLGTRILAGVLLINAGFMLISEAQILSAFVLFISGGVLLAFLLPWHAKLSEINPFKVTVALITFSAAISLPLTHDADGSVFPILLVVLFLAAAVLTLINTLVASQHANQWFALTPFLPWLGLFLFFLFNETENAIIPAAVLTALILERLTPWERLIVPQEDILSRRVIMTAFFTEMTHIIFLGALLYVTSPNETGDLIYVVTVREGALAFFILFSVMTYYAVTTVIMTTSGLIVELNRPISGLDEPLPIASEAEVSGWGRRLERYLRPFMMSAEVIRRRVQADQIHTLSRQAGIEKMRNAQLTLLLELSQQLENQLDQPVSAQLAANTLERALNCGLTTIFLHDPETKVFTLLAAAGRQTYIIPTGYQQDSSKGVIGRALRQRKTQVVNDIRTDPEYLPFKADDKSLSLVVVPLIFNGHIHGVITLGNEKSNSFGSLEVGLAESVAAELTRAWERSGYHQRLRDLIQTGSQLSSAPDPETAAREVASISRNTVQAKFAYIYIQLGQDQSYILRAASGNAPILRAMLNATTASSELIKMALHASRPFRVRDVRKYDPTSNLQIDNTSLRSMLAIPIRWHQVNIGAIFVFGKQKEVFFSENDESLAELISTQASGAFESTWLQQEIRASLRITSLLYRLSNQIIQSENIEEAASDIAQTAHKLGKNIVTGIILFDQSNRIITEIQLNDSGRIPNGERPTDMINDAIHSGQMLCLSQGKNILRTCLPIQTPIRSYGALWLDSYDDPNIPATNPNDLQALVNQSAIALERSLLLVESRRQAREIKKAYDTLEATYDQTLASLTSALDARDRETEGHSMRVTKLALKLGESLGYTAEQLKVLERGSILHDIGKIGISDNILHKPGPLTEDEWKVMHLHPGIGARIVNGIPFLQDTIQLIECHQERWDGSGYPLGLKGKEIPELARLFAIIDAFDALTSNRPYRQKVSKEEALQYLKEMSGIHFDPDMVTAFEALIQKEPQLLALHGE